MQESHVDHFTPQDRRELIELSVMMKNVRDDLTEMRAVASENARANTRARELGDEENAKQIERLQARLRVLEDFRWYILGAIAAAGILGGFFSKLFNH